MREIYEHGERFRQEFSTREVEWDLISRFAPFYVFWGLEYLVFSIVYNTARTDKLVPGHAWVLFSLFSLVLLLLTVVYHTYLHRNLAPMSLLWLLADGLLLVTIISLSAILYWLATDAEAKFGVVQGLYAAHFTKHLLVTLEFHVAVTARRELQVDSGTATATGKSTSAASSMTRGCEPDKDEEHRSGTRKPNARSETSKMVQSAVGVVSILLSLTWVTLGVVLALSQANALEGFQQGRLLLEVDRSSVDRVVEQRGGAPAGSSANALPGLIGTGGLAETGVGAASSDGEPAWRLSSSAATTAFLAPRAVLQGRADIEQEVLKMMQQSAALQQVMEGLLASQSRFWEELRQQMQQQ